MKKVVKYKISNEENQLEMMAKTSGRAIKYIENPSAVVQLEAVRQSGGYAIKYIENPTEEAQLEAFALIFNIKKYKIQ